MLLSFVPGTKNNEGFPSTSQILGYDDRGLNIIINP